MRVGHSSKISKSGYILLRLHFIAFFPIAAVLAERSRHAAQVIGLERTVGSIRPNHRHVSDVVANLKVMYAIAELIDFPNDIIAQDERRLAARGLGVEAAAYQHVGLVQTRGKHPDPHLAVPGRRHGRFNYLQPVGTAEAADLDNPVAPLRH